MIFVTVVIGLAAATLLLSTLSDLLSLGRIFAGSKPSNTATARESPRLLFLVPAHDEELLLASCLRSLQAMRYPRERYHVAVIADNCSDRTDEIARDFGIECLVRTDPVLRGKPHAIAWAVQQLPVERYDSVVIIDADAIVDPGFAEGVAETGPLAHTAVQPFNDVRNPAESSVTRMAAVLAGGMFRGAFPLKARAGLNVPLGCGMCVGREVLAAQGWKAFSLSEDWEWYAILVSEGVPIHFAPRAHLYAQEAKSLSQSGSQRQRWMAGKLTTLLRRGPQILRSRRSGTRQKLDAIAELAATGPAVHLGLVLLLELIVFAAAPPWERLLGFLLLASLIRPVVYAVIGLVNDPQPLMALRAFAYLPIYTLWRVAAFVGTLKMLGDKPWIRTERH